MWWFVPWYNQVLLVSGEYYDCWWIRSLFFVLSSLTSDLHNCLNSHRASNHPLHSESHYCLLYIMFSKTVCLVLSLSYGILYPDVILLSIYWHLPYVYICFYTGGWREAGPDYTVVTRAQWRRLVYDVPDVYFCMISWVGTWTFLLIRNMQINCTYHVVMCLCWSN